MSEIHSTERMDLYPEYKNGEPKRISKKSYKLFPLVLEQVNMVRMALAIGEGKLLKLPKGVPGVPEQCVLARALSNGWEANVSGAGIRLSNSHLSAVQLDDAASTLTLLGFRYVRRYSSVIRFDAPYAWEVLINEFDNENLPSLILKDGA